MKQTINHRTDHKMNRPRIEVKLLRLLVLFTGFILFWSALVHFAKLPNYILPTPSAVFKTLVENQSLLLEHAYVTGGEILLGFILGCTLGIFSALFLQAVKPARPWLMPVLVMTQALPAFALAPILVLWLGYGMASKIAMATLIIYFPVTSACYDGLRNTQTQWLYMAKTMQASKWRILWHIRLPAALPALGSGLRVAAAAAPIGAIVGEWVGSTNGLGYLMLHANARMQTALMFAALCVVCAMSLMIYFAIDACLNKALKWQKAQI